MLKSGFVLRDAYLDFADMRSEYDTIHLMNSDYAGKHYGWEQKKEEVKISDYDKID